MFVFIFVFSPSHSPFVSYVLSSHLLFQKRKRISRARLIRFDVPARVAKAISSSGPSLLPLPFERERTLYDREMPNSIKSRRSDLISRDAGERNVRRLNTSYRQNCKPFTPGHLNRRAAATDPATAVVSGGQL